MLTMDDEYFWAEIAAKVASDAAAQTVDRPCAAVDFPPLLPKGQGEMAVVAISAMGETADYPTTVLLHISCGLGAKAFVEMVVDQACVDQTFASTSSLRSHFTHLNKLLSGSLPSKCRDDGGNGELDTQHVETDGD